MPDFPATDPLFLSTLSLRRATPRPSPSCHPVWDFYPRSPCGERPGTIGAAAGTAAISIHALLAESDPTRWAPTCRISNFYPRSPCGERLSYFGVSNMAEKFLSTLSLRRATAQATIRNTYRWQFLSTLSLRRATATSSRYLRRR